jgi:hypothetical protein
VIRPDRKASLDIGRCWCCRERRRLDRVPLRPLRQVLDQDRDHFLDRTGDSCNLEHLYRQTRKLSRLVMATHSELALDIRLGRWAT